MEVQCHILVQMRTPIKEQKEHSLGSSIERKLGSKARLNTTLLLGTLVVGATKLLHLGAVAPPRGHFRCIKAFQEVLHGNLNTTWMRWEPHYGLRYNTCM